MGGGGVGGGGGESGLILSHAFFCAFVFWSLISSLFFQ